MQHMHGNHLQMLDDSTQRTIGRNEFDVKKSILKLLTI